MNDGFYVGQLITVAGSSNGNDGTYEIAKVDQKVLTLAEGENLTTETGVAGVTVTGYEAAASVQDNALQIDFIKDPNGPDKLVRSDGGDWEADGFYGGQSIFVTGSSHNNTGDTPYLIESTDGDILYLVEEDGLDTDEFKAELRNEFSVTRVTVLADVGKVTVNANNRSVIVAATQSGSPLLLETEEAETSPSDSSKKKFGNNLLGGQTIKAQEPGKVAMNGTFSLANVDNTTHGHIDGGYIITTPTDLDVKANDATYLVNGSLAYAYAGDIGGAANIAVNRISRDTVAELGSVERDLVVGEQGFIFPAFDLPKREVTITNDPRGEVFVTGVDNINVHATNGGGLVSMALSGVLQSSAGQKPAQEEDATLAKGVTAKPTTEKLKKEKAEEGEGREGGQQEHIRAEGR